MFIIGSKVNMMQDFIAASSETCTLKYYYTSYIDLCNIVRFIEQNRDETEHQNTNMLMVYFQLRPLSLLW